MFWRRCATKFLTPGTNLLFLPTTWLWKPLTRSVWPFNGNQTRRGLAANNRARARARLRVRARRTFTAEKKKPSVLLDSGVRRNDDPSTKSEANAPNDLNAPNAPNAPNEPNDLNIVSDKHPASIHRFSGGCSSNHACRRFKRDASTGRRVGCSAIWFFQTKSTASKLWGMTRGGRRP